MSIIAETRENNMLMLFKGITFVNPFFRQVFGQSPSSIDVVSLPKEDLDNRIRDEIDKKQHPFLVLVRDENELIEDAFVVPLEKKDDKYTVLLEPEYGLHL